MSEGRFAVEPAVLQFGAAVNAVTATGSPVVDSADQIDQMMRDDPSPLLVVEHSPGWQAAEHARIGRLLSRRCVSSREGSIVAYRCALAGPP